jgi:hypothetical protein
VTARLLIAATVVLSIASGLGCIDVNVIQSGIGAGGGGSSGAVAGMDGSVGGDASQQLPDAGPTSYPPFSIGTSCSCVDMGAASCGQTGKCDADGGCQMYPGGTTCAAPACTSASVTPTGTCDGSGTCHFGPPTVCYPYLCNPETISCQTSCADGSDCSSGICTNGNCEGIKTSDSCNTNQDCDSSFCSDRVCCNTACEGACVSCNLVGLVGTCSPVDAGMADPHGACTDQGAPSCGHDGTCDGVGGCQMYAKGTTCAVPTCTSSEVTPTGTCDGSGTCHFGPSTVCYPYLCNPETISCKTSCADGNDCSSGICATGSCIGNFKEDAAPCRSNDECKTGFCVNGVCCDTACDGGCGVCNLTSTVGTCSAAFSGTVCRAQADACDVAETCDGTSLTCPTDRVASVGKVCRVANGPCDLSESCDGTTKTCPADGFKPTTTVCRASTGVCDAAETCNGTSAACPADAFAPATTVCRSAGGGCNVAETCTGTSSICPTDQCGS